MLALTLGASFIGLILTKKSPRYVSLEAAEAIVREVRVDFRNARFIGVFVDEDPADMVVALERVGLCGVQVHGPVEPLSWVVPPDCAIPALAFRTEEQADHAATMLETFSGIVADAFSPDRTGGTGVVFDHQLVLPLLRRGKVFVAGGLKPENIEQVVHSFPPGRLPYAFDLSSGVESAPGIKSPERLKLFFERYRRALMEQPTT